MKKREEEEIEAKGLFFGVPGLTVAVAAVEVVDGMKMQRSAAQHQAALAH